MKRFLSLFLITVLVFCLFSCGENNLTTESAIVAPQLEDGYYTGDICTMQVTFIGSSTEISYNVAFFNNDTGECYYTGTALGVAEDTREITLTNYARNDSVVTLSIGTGSVTVSCDDTAYEHDLVCGEYNRYGEDWQSTREMQNEKISLGEYHVTGRTLVISEEEGVTTFTITQDTAENGEDNELFKASTSASLGTEVHLASAEGNDVSFISSYDDSNQYVTVSAVNTESASIYTGKYTLDTNDYFSDGAYEKDGWTLAYTRYRDKSDPDEYNYIVEFTLINDDGEVVWSATESLPAESHLRSATFDYDGNELSIYKGINEKEDYVDIITTAPGVPLGRYEIKK